MPYKDDDPNIERRWPQKMTDAATEGFLTGNRFSCSLRDGQDFDPEK